MPIFLDKVHLSPRQSSLYAWADYFELRCLLSVDGYFSVDGLDEAYGESEEFGSILDDGFDEYASRQETSVSEVNDKMQQKWVQCYEILKARAVSFGSAYPFRISDTFSGLEKAIELDSPWRRWYRFLLIASMLRYIPQHNKVTDAFEVASFQILSKLVPQGSVVHGFWPGNPWYDNVLSTKLTQLAANLKGLPKLRNAAFKAGNHGDGGVDLVAWHPLFDGRSHIPIHLAQCGCSVEDWKTKPASTAISTFGAKIDLFVTEWLRYYFMPLDFSFTEENWLDGVESDLQSVIFIDRLRLVRAANFYSIRLPLVADEIVCLLDKSTFD